MNLKPYYLHTLDIKNGQGKLVPARFFDYKYNEDDDYCIFHADIKKLLSYYKFAPNAIPSFIIKDKYKPISAYNPKRETMNYNALQNIFYDLMEYFGIYNHWQKIPIEPKYQKTDFFNTPIQVSKTYEQVYKESLICNDWYKKPCLNLPIFSICHGNFKIEILKNTQYFGLNITKKQVIEYSDIAIVPIDGNHRLRALEALGARDILIKIPKNQINEFTSLCVYKKTDNSNKEF